MCFRVLETFEEICNRELELTFSGRATKGS